MNDPLVLTLPGAPALSGFRIEKLLERVRALDVGALVASVTPEGPAEAAQIEPGDVILEFARQPIDRMRGLPRIGARHLCDTPARSARGLTTPARWPASKPG